MTDITIQKFDELLPITVSSDAPVGFIRIEQPEHSGTDAVMQQVEIRVEDVADVIKALRKATS